MADNHLLSLAERQFLQPPESWKIVACHRLRFALIAILTSMIASVNFGSNPAADLIVTNTRIWTVDKARPQAKAVAAIGERIVAVGSSGDVDLWRGKQTRVIDPAGKLLLPGLNDAHVHCIDGGRQLRNRS
jgi:urease alpha subunit